MTLTPRLATEGITLYHGDTLLLLERLDVRIHALITDPHYSSGGAFRGDRTAETTVKYVSSGAREIPGFEGDTRDQLGYIAWASMWMAAAYRLALPGAIACVFTDWRQLPATIMALQAGGWVWRGVAVWDKGEGTRPRAFGFRSQCEFVVWGSAGPMRDGPDAPYQNGIYRVSTRSNDKLHIAQKPDEVMGWLLRTLLPGETVLDPFAGSGTTLVVARSLGLKAIGVECDPTWCELIEQRLSQGLLL